MEILSVYDKEFQAYGKVFEGLEEKMEELLPVLEASPLPENGTGYVPEYEPLQSLHVLKCVENHCFGGMPVQLGWCNGYNTKLNCLEYHRDSEFNYGTEDFILLLAKMDDIEDGKLDTAKVKAFRVPRHVLVEVYATTLHYAPCQASLDKGFQVLVALPKGTNTDKPEIHVKGGDDAWLWARNKWLLAHAESNEAASGAYVGLTGENIDIKELL